jgi:peptidoglycan/xylan/chitin deacetylase (PgdA/CDA1 family)
MRRVPPLLVTAIAVILGLSGCGYLTAVPGGPGVRHGRGSEVPSATASGPRSGGPTRPGSSSPSTAPSSGPGSTAPSAGSSRTTAPAQPPNGPSSSVPPSNGPASTRPPATDPSDPPTGGASTAPTGTSRAAGNGPGGSYTRVGGGRVALTFDDGPSPLYTLQLLRVLAKNHVKATFCMIGEHAAEYPDLVRRIVADGHTLCNHTWNHDLNLAQRTDAQIRADLERTNAAIHAAAPNAKIAYFRAPAGNFTRHLSAVALSMGMTPLFWQVDTEDWNSPAHGHGPAMVQSIKHLIKLELSPGGIVLSHDIHPDTITAYAQLLPSLRQHYTLVALPTNGKLD